MPICLYLSLWNNLKLFMIILLGGKYICAIRISLLTLYYLVLNNNIISYNIL